MIWKIIAEIYSYLNFIDQFLFNLFVDVLCYFFFVFTNKVAITWARIPPTAVARIVGIRLNLRI